MATVQSARQAPELLGWHDDTGGQHLMAGRAVRDVVGHGRPHVHAHYLVAYRVALWWPAVEHELGLEAPSSPHLPAHDTAVAQVPASHVPFQPLTLLALPPGPPGRPGLRALRWEQEAAAPPRPTNRPASSSSGWRELLASLPDIEPRPRQV